MPCNVKKLLDINCRRESKTIHWKWRKKLRHDAAVLFSREALSLRSQNRCLKMFPSDLSYCDVIFPSLLLTLVNSFYTPMYTFHYYVFLGTYDDFMEIVIGEFSANIDDDVSICFKMLGRGDG